MAITVDLFKCVHLRTHPLVLKSGGRSTYDWQPGGKHPIGMFSCYRPQTKLWEGNVLHLSVILFTGGGRSLSRGSLSSGVSVQLDPPLQGKERAVRILLECILVKKISLLEVYASCKKILLTVLDALHFQCLQK